MKTTREYEPSDIVISKEEGQSDPVHIFLLTQVMLALISGVRPHPEDPPDDPLFPLKRHVAHILTAAEKSGIVIAKGEAVPEVFRS